MFFFSDPSSTLSRQLLLVFFFLLLLILIQLILVFVFNFFCSSFLLSTSASTLYLLCICPSIPRQPSLAAPRLFNVPYSCSSTTTSSCFRLQLHFAHHPYLPLLNLFYCSLFLPLAAQIHLHLPADFFLLLLFSPSITLPLLPPVPRPPQPPHLPALRGGPRGPRPGAEDERRQAHVHRVRPGGAQLLSAEERVRGRGHLLPGRRRRRRRGAVAGATLQVQGAAADDGDRGGPQQAEEGEEQEQAEDAVRPGERDSEE